MNIYRFHHLSRWVCGLAITHAHTINVQRLHLFEPEHFIALPLAKFTISKFSFLIICIFALSFNRCLFACACLAFDVSFAHGWMNRSNGQHFVLPNAVHSKFIANWQQSQNAIHFNNLVVASKWMLFSYNQPNYKIHSCISDRKRETGREKAHKKITTAAFHQWINANLVDSFVGLASAHLCFLSHRYMHLPFKLN